MKIVGNAVHIEESRAIGREIRIAIGGIDVRVERTREIRMPVVVEDAETEVKKHTRSFLPSVCTRKRS